MKKIFLFFFSCFFCFVASMAATDGKVVVRYGGQCSEFLLGEVKALLFDNGVMSFEMTDGSAKRWNTDEVDCVDFTAFVGTAETAVGVLTDAPCFCFSDGVLKISSSALVSVSLFAADGMLLRETICKEELLIDMRNYSAGVYIINISGSVYKIVNR